MKRTRKVKHPASVTQGTRKRRVTKMPKQRPSKVKTSGEAVKVKGSGQLVKGTYPVPRGKQIYQDPKVVERYSFKPRKYPLTVSPEDVKKKCFSKALWVIGTGYGITLLDKNLVKQINNKITLTFHNSYPHCQQFGINPTYWTWLDPSAAMPGLMKLNEAKHQNPPIPLVHPGLAGNGKAFRKYFGNTLCPFDRYHNHLVGAASRYPICVLPGTSLKALPNHEAKKVYETPKDRTKYVRYSNLASINKKMVVYYLRSGFKKPENRSKFLRGILDEMLRSSNERYDIEDASKR